MPMETGSVRGSGSREGAAGEGEAWFMEAPFY
jgi:hypothetical protein